jgi:hypothetical protein
MGCKIYGISQNPEFIIVLAGKYCEKCGQYAHDKLCELRQINYFRKNFTNYVNENGKINN